MKSLHIIQNEIAYREGRNDWQDLVEYYIYWDNIKLIDLIDEVSKIYALSVAKETLKNASKNAMLSCDGIIDEFFTFFGEGGCSTVGVHDESILSETNIPKEVKL